MKKKNDLNAKLQTNGQTSGTKNGQVFMVETKKLRSK